MKKSVLIGMSGGVDSSAAAKMLMEKGYKVYGVYLMMHEHSYAGLADAKKVAENLEVEFFSPDLSKEFKDIVVNNFIECYQTGKTPNPCIICNPTVKFKALYDMAQEKGIEYIATGHYANIVHNKKTGRYEIHKANDIRKDQSYMLYRLPQHILSKLILPLNDTEKPIVRKYAKNAGIQVAEKKDSQDICFIPDNDYINYIINATGDIYKKGDFISPEGEKCGTHKGIIRYTVGQRRGLGVALGKRAFIRDINSDENKIYLEYADSDKLGSNVVKVEDVVYSAIEKIDKTIKCKGKIRYSAKESECVVTTDGNGGLVATFDEKVISAPGQSAVFYKDDVVLFGGFIK